jgi:VCBS repeat-containing protein/autotransporter-associated beta strand protein
VTDSTISTDITIPSLLAGDDTLTITSTGTLDSSGPAVTWNLAAASVGDGVVVDNSGTIAPTSGRAFDTTGSATGAVSFSLINEASGVIEGASDVMRIQKSVMGGSISIDNSGSITADAGRVVNVQEFNTLASFTLTNHEDASIQSTDDAIRLTTGGSAAFTGTVHIDNSGTIETVGVGSGQALDLNDITATTLGQVIVDNQATGVLESGDADAVRGSAYTIFNNHGLIQSHNGAVDSSGNDAIDFQANVGGVVNNFSDGHIIGARHGITGDEAVTIDNAGEITGQLGAGVNLDTLASVTATLTNESGGVITGNADGTSDGDGVDIDGLVTIYNHGDIEAHGTWTGGLSEAVSVGGGEIHNYSGGLIHSVQRAITIDDSNLGNAFGATTITNDGVITGDSGEAISITDTFADTLINRGTINGSVALGGGDDVVDLYVGSSEGAIDGGDGADTIHLALQPVGFAAPPFPPTVGVLAAAISVETLAVDSGDWKLVTADSFASGMTIAGGASLQVGDGANAGGLIADVVDHGSLVFDRADVFEFDGAVSGDGDLVMQGSGTLVLGGHSSFDGGVILAAGTLELATSDAVGTGAITFQDGAQTLELDATAFAAGALAPALKDFGAEDAIGLRDVVATGLALNGQVLTVHTAGGDLHITFDASQDLAGKTFHFASDGEGGTLLTLGDNSDPVITGGGVADRALVEAGVDGDVRTATASAITFTDPDSGDTPVFDTTGWTEVGASNLYTQAGEYGVATLNVHTGVITYKLDNANADVQALTTGQHVIDGFTVSVIDGQGGQAAASVIFNIEGDNDVVSGTAAADTMTGTANNDALSGLGGDDILAGGAGDDVLSGGAGVDTASYAGRHLVITASLAEGTAVGDGSDTLVSIENLIGSEKGDTLSGDAKANMIDGGAGNDLLIASGGADTLVGGAGSDRFAFQSLISGKVTLIADLTDADRIDLNQIDANTAKDGDQKFKIVDAFTHHAGQLTLAYDATHDRTVLSLDVDGDAKADMTVWISGDHASFDHFAL